MILITNYEKPLMTKLMTDLSVSAIIQSTMKEGKYIYATIYNIYSGGGGSRTRVNIFNYHKLHLNDD